MSRGMQLKWYCYTRVWNKPVITWNPETSSFIAQLPPLLYQIYFSRLLDPSKRATLFHNIHLTSISSKKTLNWHSNNVSCWQGMLLFLQSMIYIIHVSHSGIVIIKLKTLRNVSFTFLIHFLYRFTFTVLLWHFFLFLLILWYHKFFTFTNFYIYFISTNFSHSLIFIITLMNISWCYHI